MSIDGLIIECMDLSHIHIAVTSRVTSAEFLFRRTKNNSFYCSQVIATSSGTLYHCIVLPKSDEADVETSSQVSDASCKFKSFPLISVSGRVLALRTLSQFFLVKTFSSKFFLIFLLSTTALASPPVDMELFVFEQVELELSLLSR